MLIFIKKERDVRWEQYYDLDPAWTDEFMATGIGIYASGVLSPKEVELLNIAFDASYTHMYAPGTRRHIKGALKAGATMEEIMEVLKLCVVQGVQACYLGVSILAEEWIGSKIIQGQPERARRDKRVRENFSQAVSSKQQR